MLAELMHEAAAKMENLTHGWSAVLNLFQHCPMTKAARVRPNPL